VTLIFFPAALLYRSSTPCIPYTNHVKATHTYTCATRTDTYWQWHPAPHTQQSQSVEPPPLAHLTYPAITSHLPGGVPSTPVVPCDHVSLTRRHISLTLRPVFSYPKVPCARLAHPAAHLTYPAACLPTTPWCPAILAHPAAHLTYPAILAHPAAHLTYPAARLAILHGAPPMPRPHVSLTRRPCTHHSNSVSTLRVTIASSGVASLPHLVYPVGAGTIAARPHDARPGRYAAEPLVSCGILPSVPLSYRNTVGVLKTSRWRLTLS
jgi:hypothetical protein